MATIFLVKNVTDPGKIVEAEGEIEGERFAIVPNSETGQRDIYAPGEWTDSREKAVERVTRNVKNRQTVRAKQLPELIAKAKERVAELEKELADATASAPAETAAA